MYFQSIHIPRRTKRTFPSGLEVNREKMVCGEDWVIKCFGGDSIRRGPGGPGSGGSLPPTTLSRACCSAGRKRMRRWNPRHCNPSCLDALYSIQYFENTLHLPVSKSRWDWNKFSQYYYYPGLLMGRGRSDWFAQGLSIAMEPPCSFRRRPLFQWPNGVGGKQTLSHFLSWARPSRSQKPLNKGEKSVLKLGCGPFHWLLIKQPMASSCRPTA